MSPPGRPRRQPPAASGGLPTVSRRTGWHRAAFLLLAGAGAVACATSSEEKIAYYRQVHAQRLDGPRHADCQLPKEDGSPGLLVYKGALEVLRLPFSLAGMAVTMLVSGGSYDPSLPAGATRTRPAASVFRDGLDRQDPHAEVH